MARGCVSDAPFEPLQLTIIVEIERKRPIVRFNSQSNPQDVERIRWWLAARPELQALVSQACALRDREAA